MSTDLKNYLENAPLFDSEYTSNLELEISNGDTLFEKQMES